MTFRPDTSFPYLALARAHGIPYAYVLQFADKLKVTQNSEAEALMSRDRFANALLRVMLAESRRRATIIHNANHTGDAP